MLVKDVMTENPITIGPEASVLEAKEIMSRNKIKKLPVVDISARAIASICCSPPESVPEICPILSFKRGKYKNCTSSD